MTKRYIELRQYSFDKQFKMDKDAFHMMCEIIDKLLYKHKDGKIFCNEFVNYIGKKRYRILKRYADRPSDAYYILLSHMVMINAIKIREDATIHVSKKNITRNILRDIERINRPTYYDRLK